MGFSVGMALDLLKAVPKIAAVAPAFKSAWDNLVGTFDKAADQQDLKDAYEAAISDAADAHQDLQDIAARHSA